jgi:hypothetical protein
LNGTGAADTFDDLDGFLSAPAAKATRSAKPAAKAAPADPWDLDALSASVPATTDYADDYASEDDDLLGELGRPAKSKV